MKRCEDCGGRAAEHPSGKDCYADGQERKRDEARESLRDELSEEGRKTQNSEQPQWFKDLLAQIPRRTLAGQVIPPSGEPDRRGPPAAALSSPVEVGLKSWLDAAQGGDHLECAESAAILVEQARAEAAAAEREAREKTEEDNARLVALLACLLDVAFHDEDVLAEPPAASCGVCGWPSKRIAGRWVGVHKPNCEVGVARDVLDGYPRSRPRPGAAGGDT